jgi:hypothetical protein
MISDVEGALPKSGALNLGGFTAAVVRIELEIWYTNFADEDVDYAHRMGIADGAHCSHCSSSIETNFSAAGDSEAPRR